MVFLPPGVSFCARKLEMSVACCIRSLLRALRAVRVASLRTRAQKARHNVDTRSPFNFCHSCVFFMVLDITGKRPVRSQILRSTYPCFRLFLLNPLVLLFAGKLLVYVPKLRFSSKYSEQLRSPQKLKISGDPIISSEYLRILQKFW